MLDTPPTPGPIDPISVASVAETTDRYGHYTSLDRETSWLRFLHRVLQEAQDPSVPLFERLFFCGVFSSNLDEYFRVRVASLRTLLRLGRTDVERLGISPQHLLHDIHRIVLSQQHEYGKVLGEILAELATLGIRIVDEATVDPAQHAYLREDFESRVHHLIEPVILGRESADPFLRNQHVYLAVELWKPAEQPAEGWAPSYALVELPPQLPRFVTLPERGKGHEVMFLDDLIRFNLDRIFPDHEVGRAYAVKLTRDADLHVDDEFDGDLVEAIRRSLVNRETGAPCRFLYDMGTPYLLVRHLQERLGLSDEDIVLGGRYHNLNDLTGFPRFSRAELAYPAWPALPHPVLDHTPSVLEAIRTGDQVLHTPYQSFEHFVRFLEEAVEDPAVEGLWLTVYRVAKDSRVLNALVRAAQAGKRVTVFFEVQARFDEESNLHWADRLEAVGARTLYSLTGLKVHAKIALVARREREGSRLYAYVGTGNFNESTARVYADHGIFTCDERVTRDLAEVFRFLAGEVEKPHTEHVLVAPFDLREGFERLIAREIEHASSGRPAGVTLKLNALEDGSIIERLYEASVAGVPIDVIARGICRLIPGVAGQSETIRVRSIVDRYLEHARIYRFHAGGEEAMYLSSADWMKRNLSRRVEVAVPVYDAGIRAQLSRLLEIQLSDNQKARIVDEHGTNGYARAQAAPPVRSQAAFRGHLARMALPRAATLLICGALGVGSAAGQVRPPPGPGVDSVSVVPADYCRAGRVYAALAGAGYRRLWTTAIKVPVADLGKLGGGGLTPLRLGGGMTTQTLHAQGVDGRRYVFRSVQKTTRQALAEEYWGTPVEAIMRDQLCSFDPSGAVIVSRLLEAVGVLHTHPRYMVLPDDPRLGEFRQQFAGMLVLFEERPDESVNGGPGFAGSDRIVQIENLFDALQEGPRERLDAAELLRSMLIDILVGDRDRSVNNYLWARFPDEKGGHVWRPVPRDRDQAFVRFDGALKALARTYDNRLVSFGDHYPDLEGLTRNAWDIDRNLLVGLDRERWNAIVREVQRALTDEVISEAVHRLPPEHYALVGTRIEASLRKRRDSLGEASAALYRIVFQDADLQATDADEVALVRGVGDGRIRVAIFLRGTASDTVGRPYFDRTFSPGVTREIRLYLHGGDDLVRVEGSTGSPIVVRAIGGGGRDELVHRSGPRKVIFYDGGDRTRVEGDHTELVHRAARPAYSWWVDGPSTPDWGAERFPVPVFGYDRDRGLVLGLGVRRDAYGFLKKPFGSRTVLSAGWAIGPSEPILEYRQYVQDALGPWSLQLRARYSGIEVLRYYGPGNETTETEDPAYYRVHQKQLIVSAEAALGNGDLRWVSVGPVFRHTSSDTSNAATFIAQSRPYGTGSFSQLGLRVSWNLDGRHGQAAPRSGYHVEGEAAYYPQALDVRGSFGTMQGDAAVYASPPGGNPTLALRVGGRRVWGDYPYSDAAFLGGKNDVRGLREQRYSGDAAVFGNAELRVFLTRFFLLFPMDFGVFGLTDAGRVFVEGESSNAWHGSWGGGLWLAPVSRAATVHLSLARHDHRTLLYVGTGFAF